MNRINKISRRTLVGALAASAAAPAYGQVLRKKKKQKPYLAPGVYVEEIPSSLRTIRPAETSVTLFIDVFGGGPLATVTGIPEFQSVYGMRPGASETALEAVKLYFRNGGQKALLASLPNGSAASLLGAAGASGVRHLLGGPLLNIDFICIPPASALSVAEASAVYSDALLLAEEQKAMLLIDAPAGPVFKTNKFLSSWRAPLNINHPNAAIYAPRLTVAGVTPTLPASAATAGIAARIDRQYGVWKAPSGSRATISAAAPAATLSTSDIEKLTQANVNALHTLPGRSAVVWGARTTSSDSEWKFVPVRRMALFIEKSLDASLDWTVFEPNGEPLWSQVRSAVSSFLEGLMREGALAGPTSSKAYFVHCDSSTTTQSDIERGVFNLLVGFAPLRPAEFIIIRKELRAAQP